MNRRMKFAVGTIAVLCLGAVSSASAQSLKEKVVGAWVLESASENFADGKTLHSWASGNLILDPTGHMAMFLIGKDRAKTSESVRTPAGPAVAFYGTYSVDEAGSVINLKIESGVTPVFDGSARPWKISVKGDMLTTTSPETKTPDGMMIPVNEWKKLK